METFEQFMIMENAIDDIQTKYIKNTPGKRKLIKKIDLNKKKLKNF